MDEPPPPATCPACGGDALYHMARIAICLICECVVEDQSPPPEREPPAG